MKDKNKYHTNTGERVFYSSYFWGQNVFYFIVTMMLQIYLTDRVGIHPATIGVIFLVVRIWDAVIDPFFGIIVDRSNYKSGKFLPWIRLSAFIIPISTILLFVVPSNISYELKVAWVAIAHVIWGTAYTICDAPIAGLSMTITDNSQERTNLISLGRFGALLAMLMCSFFVPQLVNIFGSDGIAVTLVSIVAFLAMLPIGFKAQERFVVRSEEAISLKAIITYLKSNKYLLILLGALILGATYYVSMSMMNYVAVYCLGGVDMQGINMLSFYLPMVASVPLIMFLSKRVDKFYLFVGSFFVSAIACIIMYIWGLSDIIIYYTLNIIRGGCFGFTLILAYTFVADSTTYGTYKTKVHAEGLSFSLQTFSQKLFIAISSSLAMFVLAASGYVANAESFPTQPEKAVDSIWILYNIYPAVGAVITGLILALFYKLRNKDVILMSKVNNGILTEEEVNGQLSKHI